MMLCNNVMKFLASAAVMPGQNSNIPPVFKAISEDFKQKQKTTHHPLCEWDKEEIFLP